MNDVAIRNELKCWPSYFQAIWTGAKTFELRANDRDFHAEDRFTLREFDNGGGLRHTGGNIEGVYTGREMDIEVTYVMRGGAQHGNAPRPLARGYCIFSFNVLEKRTFAANQQKDTQHA